MRNKIISTILLLILGINITACSAGNPAPEKTPDVKQLWELNKERAFELGNRYKTDFYNYQQQRLALRLTEDSTASCWEYIGLMSLQDKLAKLDENERLNLDHVIVGLSYYGYMKSGKLWGYVVHRGSSPLGAKDPGLAYDDNEWLVINYLRAYEITNNENYLKQAEYLARFIIEEAWFEPLGGIFWDSRKEARHACSNNPLIKPLVDLYKHTNDTYYLEWAKKIYDFSTSTLKNKKLNIYYDLVGAKKVGDKWVEGSPKREFYTYNTGAMISGAAALYGATGEQKYLDEALSSAKGAYDYFGDKGAKEGYVNWPSKSTVWFHSILLRGYIDLYPYAKEEALPYIEAFQKSVDYAYENYYKDGYLPRNWIEGWDEKVDAGKYSLDGSSNAEIYAMLALFEREYRSK